MMANCVDNTVPKGPPDLCFDSHAFIKETFSVDQFLQEHRTGGNLESMRDDLGLYLKVLRSAMIDLINKDYADYVNLSSNLIGLDKAISKINAPLGQLKEELLQVHQFVDSAMVEVTKKLEQKKDLRDHKRALKCLNRVQTSLKKLKILVGSDLLDIQSLERAVSEFSQLQFNTTLCFHLMSDQYKQMYSELGMLLSNSINQLFINSLKKEEGGINELCSSLFFYLKINKLDEVERLYRQRIVSPAMQPIINEETLRALPTGLSALYQKILSFVDNDMKYIREVTSQNERYPALNKFDFLLRSFWPEVEERLEINLSSIYAAGDPDTFYTKYTETISFLNGLKEKFKNPQVVEEWQCLSSFTSFMEKWNLPVYFQIRFQEIVKGVEKSLLNPTEKSKANEWKLCISDSVWNSLNRCWDSGVFILPIAHKFWKLSLQILSRYHNWIKEVLKNKVPLQKSNEMNQSSFLVFLYTDVQAILLKMPDFLKLVINKLPDISEKAKELLSCSLSECEEKLKGELLNIEKGVTGSVTSECLPLLHQVSDIPRLYRRTNREPPSKPCPYITTLMETPSQFSLVHSDIQTTNNWLQIIFSELTKQYYTSVADVLTSVQKTEESLRRLKKARDRNVNHLNSGDRRPGDDDKIRLQLLLDVKAYSQGIENLGVKKASVEKLGDLLLLVETTQKL